MPPFGRTQCPPSCPAGPLGHPLHSHPQDSNALPSTGGLGVQRFGGVTLGDGYCARCPSQFWLSQTLPGPWWRSAGIIPSLPHAGGGLRHPLAPPRAGSGCSPQGRSPFPECTQGRKGRGCPHPASPPSTFPLVFILDRQLPPVLLPGLLLQVEQDPLLLFSRPVHEVIPDLTTEATRPHYRGLWGAPGSARPPKDPPRTP